MLLFLLDLFRRPLLVLREHKLLLQVCKVPPEPQAVRALFEALRGRASNFELVVVGLVCAASGAVSVVVAGLCAAKGAAYLPACAMLAGAIQVGAGVAGLAAIQADELRLKARNLLLPVLHLSRPEPRAW